MPAVDTQWTDLAKLVLGGAGGAAVLIAWVRYMVGELAAARALIASKDNDLKAMAQAAQNLQALQLPVLERIALTLDRIERRMDGDALEERAERISGSRQVPPTLRPLGP